MALAQTCPASGRRSGASSRTSGDWRPGSIALAAIPAASVTPTMTANAAAVTAAPGEGHERGDHHCRSGRAGNERHEERGEDPLAPCREDPRRVDRGDVAAGGRQQRNRRPSREAEAAEEAVGQHRETRQVPGVLQSGDEEVEEEHVRDSDRQEAQDPRVEAPQQSRGELGDRHERPHQAVDDAARRTSPTPPRGGSPRPAPTTATRAKVSARTSGEDQEAGPRPDAPGGEAVGEGPAAWPDGLHLGRPAGGELAPDRVHQVGQEERGRPPRGDGAGRDQGAKAAGVEGGRAQRVARGQLAGRGCERPLDGGRVGAGGHERARRMGARADAAAAAGARDGEGDGTGHALARAGHGAADRDGEQLPEPARVDADPVGRGLVGEVEGDDDRESQVAAGDDERAGGGRRRPRRRRRGSRPGPAARSAVQKGRPATGRSVSDAVPGRSTRSARPARVRTSRTSRPTVVPGAFVVSAKRPLARARNVDLPTFGRPTRATTGRSAAVARATPRRRR